MRTSSHPGTILFVLLLLLGGCASGMEYIPGKSIETDMDMELREGGRIAFFRMSGMTRPEQSSGRFTGGSGSDLSITGLDEMSSDGFALLKGRRFAVLTNPTGVDRNLTSILYLLLEKNIRPGLVFEPEHGMFGFMDEPGKDGFRVDPSTGLEIYSLYSSRRKPESEVMRDLDLVVVDLQNLPVRCYTYISTLTELMESAEKAGVEVMILDRPNPYGFWSSRGAMLYSGYESFVSKAPVPYLYSLTLGEYAYYMAEVRFTKLKLSVVKVEGYSRNNYNTVLSASWINPSPNIPSFESAVVYPAVVFFEGTNVSLGRGTTRPFVYSGAPWMDSREVVRRLKALHLPGISITDVIFRPTASLYKGKVVRGVQIIPHSIDFDPIRTGYEYMKILHELHPRQFKIMNRRGQYFIDRLWGNNVYRKSIESDLTYEEFSSSFESEANLFATEVEKYRFY